MTKVELLPKSSRRAIHWLRVVKRETPLFGVAEFSEVACGHPLDRSGWAERAVAGIHFVTCKVCHEMAHPKPPMF